MTQPELADWQRPPFPPGNSLAATHHAYSPRTTDPAARQFIANLLDSPSCPPHLKADPERWWPTLEGWGQAKAIVAAFSAYLAGRDLTAALSEVTEAEEVTVTRKGGSTKKTTGRRTVSALDQMHRWTTTVRNYENDLGISPASAARLHLELAGKYDSALHVAALLEQDKETGNG